MRPGDVAHLLGVERPADRDKDLHGQGDAFAIDPVEHFPVPIGELHVAASVSPCSCIGTRSPWAAATCTASG